MTAIATLASSALSAYGSIAAGQQQKKAETYNAEAENVQAENQIAASSAQASQVEQLNQRKLGAAGAAIAASGVDATQGTPLEIMHDMATQGELTKQLTLYQGQVDAQQSRAKGVIDTEEGEAAQTAGVIQGGSTLLSSIGKVGNASDWTMPSF